MNRSVIVSIIVAIFAFLVLFYGFSPVAKQEVEGSIVKTDQFLVGPYKRASFKTLPEDYQLNIEQLEHQLSSIPDTGKVRVEVLKRLSSLWFEAGYPLVAGEYAKKVAEANPLAEAWSITGTTYSYGISSTDDPGAKTYSRDQAIHAFEQAVTLEPANVKNRINLALTYIEYPDETNPMKGVLLLRKLSEDYPEEPAVFYQLGRLSLQTGQIDNAIKRLIQSLELDPSNNKAGCLLSQAYEANAQLNLAEDFRHFCSDQETKL